MTLADLRRLAVRKQWEIRFRLRNGMECAIDRHGVARVPELKRVPDFNLEEELAAAAEFRLEEVPVRPKGGKAGPRAVPRAELETLASAAAAAGAGTAHEEE